MGAKMPSVGADPGDRRASAAAERDETLKVQRSAGNLVISILVILTVGFVGMRVGEAVARKESAEANRGGRPGSGGAAQSGWNGSGGRGETIAVQVEPVSRGAVEEAVVLSGSLEPQYQVDVFSRRAGRIERLAVSPGQRVKRGELIASVEQSDLLLQQQQAAAALAASRASYRKVEAQRDQALADYQRVKALHEQRASTQVELENMADQLREAGLQLEVAKAQLQQAEANLALAKLQLDQARTDAPVSGVVIRTLGVAGSQVTTSTPVATIAGLDPIEVAFSVAEKDFARLRPGQPFAVAVDAFPGESFRGQITSLGAVVEAATRTLPVRGQIANPSLRLRPGMFARVELVVGRQENALFVPREALMTRPAGYYVFVVSDGVARIRPVTVGIQGRDRVEILGGLQVGDLVAVVGQQQVRDGQPVRVTGGSNQPGRGEGVRPAGAGQAHPRNRGTGTPAGRGGRTR